MHAFAPDLRIADGPVVRTMGFGFSTRMIVATLADGSLWINSPVEMEDREKQRIAELGPVRYLVAPTPLHAWRLESWSRLFPNAELWVPPRMRCRGYLAAARVLGDTPPSQWAADFHQLVFRGSRVLDEVYFLHRASRTIILADFIQWYPPIQGRPLRNAAMRLAGVADGGVGLDIRLSMLGRRAQALTSVRGLLSWDFDNVILAHGPCVRGGGKAFVRRAFEWLAPKAL